MSDLHDEAFTPDITASEVVYRGAVWNVVKETFDLPEARGLVRDMIAHTGAVAVAVVDEQERILLVQQYRHPARARLWEVPAGLLDIPGEDPLTAAKRELGEEADLRAERWEVLSDSFQSPGGSSESIRIYLARDLDLIAAADRHERSAEEAGFKFRWVTVEEGLAAIGSGDVTNAIAQLAILQVANVLRAEAEGKPTATRSADAPRRLVDADPAANTDPEAETNPETDTGSAPGSRA